MDLAPTLVGLALGFGFASVIYLGVFTRFLKQIHKDNVLAAKLLDVHQTEGIQKVEEQNMTQVVKRLDRLEQEGIIRKG